jgi:hypothetical protein
MIMILNKYPWQAVEYVSMAERRRIFDCLMELITRLMIELRKEEKRISMLLPSTALLQELTVAALVCPGFSEKQKYTIVARLYQGGHQQLTEGQNMNLQLGGNHEFSTSWPFLALSLIPGVDMRLLRYFVALFREATARTGSMSLAEFRAQRSVGSGMKPMGDFTIDYGDDPLSLSMAEVAKKEYDMIEQLLSKVLQSVPGSAYAVQRYNSMSSFANSSRGNATGNYGDDNNRSLFTLH